MRIDSANQINRENIAFDRKDTINQEVKALEDVQVKTQVTAEEIKPVDKKDYSESEIRDAVEKANKHFRSFNRRLELSIHEGTKEIMVKVIDSENDEIIREIPSEKVLDMLEEVWKLTGLVLDEKI